MSCLQSMPLASHLWLGSLPLSTPCKSLHWKRSQPRRMTPESSHTSHACWREQPLKSWRSINKGWALTFQDHTWPTPPVALVSQQQTLKIERKRTTRHVCRSGTGCQSLSWSASMMSCLQSTPLASHLWLGSLPLSTPCKSLRWKRSQPRRMTPESSHMSHACWREQPLKSWRIINKGWALTFQDHTWPMPPVALVSQQQTLRIERKRITRCVGRLGIGCQSLSWSASMMSCHQSTLLASHLWLGSLLLSGPCKSLHWKTSQPRRMTPQSSHMSHACWREQPPKSWRSTNKGCMPMFQDLILPTPPAEVVSLMFLRMR